MSSLELSEEMLSVRGYLSDAKILVDEVFWKSVISSNEYQVYTGTIIEVARMLQMERTPKKVRVRPKSTPEKEKSNTSKQASSDKLMSSVRAHPKLPPLVSTEPSTEVLPAMKPRSSRASKVPVEKARPSRSQKSDPKPQRLKKFRRR